MYDASIYILRVLQEHMVMHYQWWTGSQQIVSCSWHVIQALSVPLRHFQYLSSQMLLNTKQLHGNNLLIAPSI